MDEYDKKALYNFLYDGTRRVILKNDARDGLVFQEIVFGLDRVSRNGQEVRLRMRTPNRPKPWMDNIYRLFDDIEKDFD